MKLFKKTVLLISISFAAILPVSANSSIPYRWATNNQNGGSTRTAFIPANSNVIGIAVREQSGFGVINARLIYKNNRRNEAYWTTWTTSNQAGRTREGYDNYRKQYKPVGIEVEEQPGFGIVDMRIIYLNTQTGNYLGGSWSTNSTAQGSITSSLCPRTRQLKGLQVREQSGFGIINARVYCE